MSLQRAIGVIAELANKGAIQRYAIIGGVAALNYVQPTLTEDLDVLVSIAEFETRKSGLLLLKPIEEALAKMGYTKSTGLGYLIEGWPVQFVPVSSKLDEEALEKAVELDIGMNKITPTKARVLRAEYLVALALKVGRLKDLARIEVFLDQDVVDLRALREILERFDLMPAWKAFCMKAGRKNPLM